MAAISLLFFASGVSGLIYQVVWVRTFGNIFGNTVYSASLVVAVFMLGLGIGSYVVGNWADRQYAARPESLIRWYGLVEMAIGLMGLAISAFLPHLGAISALASSDTRGANGWYHLSVSSYAARVAIATLLLTPITLLMGGTLTLLIRYCVRLNLEIGAWRIALLYGVNTAGAAAGAFLTDFALVPLVGLATTQWLAVLINLLVAAGAFLIAARPMPEAADIRDRRTNGTHDAAGRELSSLALASTSLALALSGFAAMGMEILWFRHFTLLLGGFRAVFSLALSVILIGIFVGALVGGWLNRFTPRPVQWLMLGEGLFVAATVFGLAITDVRNILTAEANLAAVPRAPDEPWQWARAIRELWLIASPMLIEVGIPALIMGLTFPMANAIVQRAEGSVGHRAGVLYFSNTFGAVCGSLAAGFLLLPVLGIQASASVLIVAAALTIVPLFITARQSERPGGDAAAGAGRASLASAAAAALVSGIAIMFWLLLPPEFVIVHAQTPPGKGERRLSLVEGINEVVSVVDLGGHQGRMLLTNGHPMSSTTLPARRYMRALAHIPLLSMDRPETALVIGFGVGNTTHAIALHPTIRRVEIADLSRQILEHARFFEDANHGALNDPRVVVYVDDGRQHLRTHEGAYDLITLEPPPIAQAGVGALYSREFYLLARARLKPDGYISQWLPAYQVPASTTLAMIRAFVDVFPQAVLLSGSNQELLLIGTTRSRIEFDPERAARALANAPAVRADLEGVGLGTITEIVGTFVASPRTLDAATRGRAPATDDRPIQEYGAKSRLNPGYQRLPASIFDLGQVAVWCPRCFVDGKPTSLATGLDTYLDRLAPLYKRTLLDSY